MSILEERLGQKRGSASETSERKRPSYEEEETFEDEPYKAETEEEDIPLTEEDLEELNRISKSISEEESAKTQKRKNILSKTGTVIMALLCIYIITLIYGVIITEYEYNDAGKIVPVEMSVEEIQKRNDFALLSSLYLQARSVYEQLLSLDYRVAGGQEEAYMIGPEYEKVLSTVDRLVTQIQAASVAKEYTQILELLEYCVNTHMAVYCQNMSSALTTGSKESAEQALLGREELNSTFQTITQNLVTIGRNIRGYDITDIEDWSPDGYIVDTYQGGVS